MSYYNFHVLLLTTARLNLEWNVSTIGSRSVSSRKLRRKPKSLFWELTKHSHFCVRTKGSVHNISDTQIVSKKSVRTMTAVPKASWPISNALWLKIRTTLWICVGKGVVFYSFCLCVCKYCMKILYFLSTKINDHFYPHNFDQKWPDQNILIA